MNINKNENNEKNEKNEEECAVATTIAPRITDIMSLYNQIFTSIGCNQWAANSSKMKASFIEANKMLKSYAEWKNYFLAIREHDFKHISKLNPPLILSDNMIAGYINGEFKQDDTFATIFKKQYEQQQKES